MTHLLSIQGKIARGFFIDSASIENFKAVVRGVTSGCVFVVSSKNKTDIFYGPSEDKHESILKVWKLYASEHSDVDNAAVKQFSGSEAFTYYFESLIMLSANWYWYKNYRKYFLDAYLSDTGNLLANQIIDCEDHLMKNKKISRIRSRLIDQEQNQSKAYPISKEHSQIAEQLLRQSRN